MNVTLATLGLAAVLCQAGSPVPGTSRIPDAPRPSLFNKTDRVPGTSEQNAIRSAPSSGIRAVIPGTSAVGAHVIEPKANTTVTSQSPSFRSASDPRLQKPQISPNYAANSRNARDVNGFDLNQTAGDWNQTAYRVVPVYPGAAFNGPLVFSPTYYNLPPQAWTNLTGPDGQVPLGSVWPAPWLGTRMPDGSVLNANPTNRTVIGPFWLNGGYVPFNGFAGWYSPVPMHPVSNTPLSPLVP